jgi:hypothetical protein
MEQNPDIYWKHHVPISRKLGQLEKKKKKRKKKHIGCPSKLEINRVYMIVIYFFNITRFSSRIWWYCYDIHFVANQASN